MTSSAAGQGGARGARPVHGKVPKRFEIGPWTRRKYPGRASGTGLARTSV